MAHDDLQYDLQWCAEMRFYMGKWRGSLAVHIILPLLLAVAIGFSTVAGMIIEGTKEYANEGGQKQEDFYVSQNRSSR